MSQPIRGSMLSQSHDRDWFWIYCYSHQPLPYNRWDLARSFFVWFWNCIGVRIYGKCNGKMYFYCQYCYV